MGLSDFRPGATGSYVFLPAVAAGSAPRRISQVPRSVCQRALSPFTPESLAGAFDRSFSASTGLHHSWEVGRLSSV